MGGWGWHSGYYNSSPYGPYYGGGIGIVVLIVILLLIFGGRIW